MATGVVRVHRHFASPHALVRVPVKRLRLLDLRPFVALEVERLSECFRSSLFAGGEDD